MTDLHERRVNYQRQEIDLQYRRKEDLDGKQLVYPNQREAAAQIHTHFLEGKRCVVLIAQPGMGKTGAQLETVRLLCTRPYDTPLLEDVAVVSGMSDTDWESTMRKGLLPCLGDRVFHRGRLPNADALSKMRHGLIVADECHVASGSNNVLGKTLKKAGLLNIENLDARDMRMLDVSATPEGVSEQIRLWGDKAAIVILQPGPIYKGFQSMLEDGCLRDASEFDLKNSADALRLLLIWNNRYYDRSKRWFPMRVYSPVARDAIARACHVIGWADPKVHDSNDRIEDIEGEMEVLPAKHTVILIKQFWRASKRLIRTNVGGTYETSPAKTDTTATSQGLTARFCDNFEWSGEQTDVNLRPLHFTDVSAVKQYLHWYMNGCVYATVQYTAARMKSEGDGHVKAPISKIHPMNVAGLEGVAEQESDSVRLYDISPTFRTQASAEAWCDLKLTYGKSAYRLHGETCTSKTCRGCGSTHIKYRKTVRPLLSETELRDLFARGENFDDHRRQMNLVAHIVPVIDVQLGIAGGARVMPVLLAGVTEGGGKARVMPVNDGSNIVWIAIYKKSKLRKFTIKNLLAARPL
jgi:hypothetical protein